MKQLSRENRPFVDRAEEAVLSIMSPSLKQWLRDKRLLLDKAAETAFSIMPQSIYLKMKWRYHILSRSKGELEEIRPLRTLITTRGRSFKPFDDTKSIFVHIPKCAGDSVSIALFGNSAGGHATLSDYVNIFEPERVASYFKFTIVRNPWDRLVSAFHFLKKGGWNEADRLWFNAELGHFKDFDEFVKGWVSKDNIWKRWYLQPQYHFIVEGRRKIDIDFVGYLENIDEDFRYIAKRIGIDCQLQHINKSKHDDYKNLYNEETKAIVAEVYETDIKLLGYNFDNSSLPAQLARRSMGGALDFKSSGARGGTGRF